MDKKHYVITCRSVKKEAGKEDRTDDLVYANYTPPVSERAVYELHFGRYSEGETDEKLIQPPHFFPPGDEDRDYSAAANWPARFEPREGSRQILAMLFDELETINKDLLIFIHGFDNNTQKEMQHLELLHNAYAKPGGSAIGRIMMLTWPSKGKFAYNAQGAGPTLFEIIFGGAKQKLDIVNDKSDFAVAGDVFSVFLIKLRNFLSERYEDRERPGIHLVVQSMANQVLARAAWQIENLNKNGELQKLFRSIVLTSPDVPQDFLETFSPYKNTLGWAEQCWITYSKEDNTLKMSAKTDGDPKQSRLGRNGPLNGTTGLPENTALLEIYQDAHYNIENKPIDFHHRLFEYNRETVDFYRTVFEGNAVIPQTKSVYLPAVNLQPGAEKYLNPDSIWKIKN